MKARRAGRAAGAPLFTMSLATLLSFGSAACSDPDLERMEKVRGAVCVCKDAACVEAALKELPAAGPREQRQAQRLAQEILFCIARVGEMEPAAPPPAASEPSPAEAPAAPPPAAR